MKSRSLILLFIIIQYVVNAQYNDTTVVELITFESESTYFRQGTPTLNIWQIGQPSKVNFNESYSAVNAIVTDTLNFYPKNNNSYFELIIPLINNEFLANIGIGFYHKILTPKNSDGGYITVSYDNGKNWINIINDTVCPFMYSPTNNLFPNINLYNNNSNLINGESGYSGSILDWEYVEFYWVINMVTKSYSEIDTLHIRFNFISDDIDNNMEGWMIDDIRLLYNHYVGSISNNKSEIKVNLFPNPVSQNAILKTKNLKKIKTIDLYSINGQKIKTIKVNSSVFHFERKELQPGTYLIKCNFVDGTQTIKLLIEN